MGSSITRGWRLLVPLALVNVTLFAAYSGVLSVLLPGQIADIDPTGKVGALAAVTSVSFAVTALAQPLFGALSDRTFGRWGRRMPWMLAGALSGGVALGAMGGAHTVIALVLLWSIAQFSLNATDIAASAYLVDGFPPRRRGLVAGILGAAAIAGGAGGSLFAGSWPEPAGVTYGVLAMAVFIAVVLFTLTVHDGQSARPASIFRWRDFFLGFIVSPRRHPDFWWVFAWRMCFTLAAGVVQGYLLYILTDYVLVAKDDAAGLVGGAIVIGGVAVIVSVLIGGWLSDRMRRRKLFLIIASAVVLATDLIPIMAPSVTAIFVLAAGLGIGLGLSIACGTALMSEVLPDPENHAARGLGIFNIATNAGQALAPILAATVITVVGYPFLFAISGALMLVAMLLVTRVRTAR